MGERLSRYLVAVFIVLLPFLVKVSDAEILPSKGTFRGNYHENRAGVGHFKFFTVSAELVKELAPYNGKYVEIEVLNAIQPINPGPAFIRKIGQVMELSPPPLSIEIKTVRPGSDGDNTFDVVYSFRNIGRRDVELDANSILIGLEGFKDVERPEEVDPDFGYTRRQRMYGGSATQVWNFIDPQQPGMRNHFYTRRVKLKPGQAAPFVWHSVKAVSGEYEIVVSTTLASGGGEPIPALCRHAITLPLKSVDKGREDLAVHAKITRDAEWLVVDGRLANETDRVQHVFVQPNGRRFFFPALVQLEDSEGKPLLIDLDWDDPSSPWVHQAIDREGLPFQFRVRQVDHFKSAAEARLGLWTGIEKLTVTADVPQPPAIADVPWGTEDNGCRLRIRMAQELFTSNQEPRFFFHVESDRTTADILWINQGDVVVEVDGKAARPYMSQLIHSHVLKLPHQGEVSFSRNHGFGDGKHTLKVTVRGRGGEYTNLRNETWRKFEGTLHSNEVQFETRK